MAKQTAKTSTVSTTRTRVNKNGASNASGYKQCNVCRGTGIVRKGR